MIRRLQVVIVLALVATQVELARSSFPVEVPNERSAKVVDLSEEVDESFRLPKDTFPVHYYLHLRTAVHDDGNPNFEGNLELHLDVVEPTSRIILLNRGLTITAATLIKEAEDEELEPSLHYDERTEKQVFQFDSTLEPGRYILHVDYTGRLQTSTNSGFFRKYYRDEQNVRRYLASTQFEPTRARMAFPCYDEPAFKAAFTVSITHHKSYSAVSNMPQDGDLVVDESDPEYVTTVFQTTAKMSSYLLAFVVSDFETRTLAGQLIHARANAIDETEFALISGVKTLEQLSSYYSVPYNKYMPKIAQIAIPDWGSGAMENWGLVTYGEPALLFDPAVNTYHNKRGIATVIGHEYAHQWFGNLVTCDWWGYIWLNEGFATLYGYYGADLAYPGEQYMDFFQLDVLQLALAADSSESTRPMNWDAATPTEISGLFDRIAYEKSGSVLNMFRVVFGDTTWRAGLKNYLENRQLSTGLPDDLYGGLQDTQLIDLPNSLTVKDVMESWTSVAGYPVLNVRRLYDKREVVISQDRFWSDRRLPNDHVWYIPYNVANQRDEDFTLNEFQWLTTKAARIQLDVDEDQWVIFNRQQVGFYRVNYDPQNWELIIKALIANPQSIHPFNRAQLIDDAFNLAKADLLDFSIVLRLITSLKHDIDYIPWAAANNVLNYVHKKLLGTAHQSSFERYVTSLIDVVYDELHIDSVSSDETLTQKYLKQLFSTWSCRIGYKDCQEKSKNLLNTAIRTNVGVHPDIASVIYCHGLQHSTDEEFRWLYDRMANSKNTNERNQLLGSLACSKNTDHLKALLTSSIGTVPEIQYYESERLYILQAVYSAGRTGVDALLQFLDNWDMAEDYIYWMEQSTFNLAIRAIAERTNTPEELGRLEHLFETVGDLAPADVVDQALATVSQNFDWFNSLEGLIVIDFLENYSYAEA
ncbi:aminopeptidase N-like [Uranotaenia lowii]|uniref:aminopeptidase N-like n=1 Tax=Uranotaenia lowii TaxID=190385 RepID=UPI002479D84D|nr:aminopeptidase N-like [Uranotaenia lowii]